jgi:hypothetical protein
VDAVAVEVAVGAVVVLGGAGVGVSGQDLGVAERDAGVEGVGDRRVTQGVRAGELGFEGLGLRTSFGLGDPTWASAGSAKRELGPGHLASS